MRFKIISVALLSLQIWLAAYWVVQGFDYMPDECDLSDVESKLNDLDSDISDIQSDVNSLKYR